MLSLARTEDGKISQSPGQGCSVQSVGGHQVQSHRAPGNSRNQHALCRKPSASSPMPLRPTCLVRAGVRRSARLRARCDRAAMALAGCALGRSGTRAAWLRGLRGLEAGGFPRASSTIPLIADCIICNPSRVSSITLECNELSMKCRFKIETCKLTKHVH